MKLVFTDQYANMLLLLNGLVILIFMYGRTKKKERTMKFGNYKTLKKVAGGDLIRSDTLIMITRILAITCLLIGLSSPAIVQTVQGADNDFVITMDVSSSMFTGDVEPNRFEASKETSTEFVSRLGNSSKVGVVSYSGDVNEELELSSEMNQVRAAINGVEMGETAGTATGDAVATSVSMLISSNQTKTVILITDGTNNVGQSIEEAANFAARQNVTVNPIGIGEAETEEQEADGTIRGEEATRAEFPNLNQTKLIGLANETGGEARFATSREGLEDSIIDLEEQEVETDVSRYLIMLAGILLVLDAIYRTTDFEVIP